MQTFGDGNPVNRVGNHHGVIHIGRNRDFHGAAFGRHFEIGGLHNQGIQLALGDGALGALGAGGDGHFGRTVVVGFILQHGSLDGAVAGLAAGRSDGDP